MKLAGVIFLVCLAEAAFGSYFSNHATATKRSSVRSHQEENVALKRPQICRTKPRVCEKIKFKVCSKACVTPKKPSCCAHHIVTSGDTVTLGGRGLCFTQGYIKRNFKLTLANPELPGKEQAEGKNYLFMCPEGTDLLTTTSRRGAPSIEKNWKKLVKKMNGEGEVGYFGIRTSSWVKTSRRFPALEQLAAYANVLLSRAEKEKTSLRQADFSDDKFLDYLMTSH